MEHKIEVISKWLGAGSINIFGPPFSGKDTQARKLAKIFNGVVISGGDILRHNHGNKDVQQIMAKGGVIPSEMFLSIIPPFFQRPELNNKPLFLSSVGRLMSEVPTIKTATDETGHSVKAIILLRLPTSKIWDHYEVSKKLNDRGTRIDDNPESLKIRIEEFEKSQPVIDYYRSNNLLIEIDDSRSPDEVERLILGSLYDRALDSAV